MKSLIAIVALIAGCGGDDGDTTPAPECALTAADLRAPSDTKRACIRKVFATDPARAATALAQLDWVNWKTTTRELEALPVEPRWWYLIALAPEASLPVARTALILAGRTPDPIFAADVDLAAIHIATRATDESTANSAIERLLVNNAKLGAQKLELLDILAKRSDRERIERICRKQNEATIAWRCLELAPSLRESLAACGRLPVLSFRDIGKFAPLATKLEGLRCRTGSARGIASVFDRIDRREPATPEEVTIYSRLALDAPREAEKCFLEEAARGCLALIRGDDPCPVLDSVARYVAVVADEDRLAAFQAVFEGKNHEYDLLFSNGRPQAGANLFHLHVLLAEMLASNPTIFPNPIRAYERPYYHVIRAWRFWANVKDQTVPFADMLSPKLRDGYCADTDCSATCRLPWHGEPHDCRAACMTVREKLSCP